MGIELSGNAYPELDHTAPAAGKTLVNLQHFELSEEGTDPHMRPAYPVAGGIMLPPNFGVTIPVEDRAN